MTARVHPSIDEWARLLDGEVTANRAAQLEAHAAGCADCEREIAPLSALVGELGHPVIDSDQHDVAAIMRRLDETPAPAGPGRRIWWYSAAAVASAAAILIAVSTLDRAASPRDQGTFAARGGAGDPGSRLSRLVGFALWAGADAGDELADGDVVSADTPLTATYRNLGDRPAFALIFAIDAAGDVHWLYPAYVDPDTDPVSVRLSPNQRAGQFGETVVLDVPAAGAMTIVAMASAEPLSVSSIESLDDPSVAAIAETFPDAALSTVSVEVGP